MISSMVGAAGARVRCAPAAARGGAFPPARWEANVTPVQLDRLHAPQYA